MKRYLIICLAAMVSIFSSCSSRGSLTRAERGLMAAPDSLMHVLTIADKDENATLRKRSAGFRKRDMKSAEFRSLIAKMKYTVQDPSQDGVGIAAPQVGLNRRLIIVCRLDKPGEPFEAYANAHIEEYLGEVSYGSEGCLSVPPYRGDVPRYEGVIVSYRDPFTLEHKRDTVTGYTAIIFQHENDHLDGTIYRDKAGNVTIDEDWKEERREFSDKGLYDKPDWMKYPKAPEQ